MQHGTGAGAWDLARNGDRGAGFWKKHGPRNSQRVLGGLALLSGTVFLPFPPQCFFLSASSVLSRPYKQLKAALLSAAVSSCPGGSLASCPSKQSRDFVYCAGIKPCYAPVPTHRGAKALPSAGIRSHDLLQSLALHRPRGLGDTGKTDPKAEDSVAFLPGLDP